MLRNIVGAALIMGLPYLAIAKVVPGDVLGVGAVLLGITWLALATPKEAKRRPQVSGAGQPLDAKPQAETASRDHEDDYFGHIYQTQDSTELYVSLRQACNLAAKAPAEFIGHLSRLLRDLPNRSLVLIGETSYPEFGKLLAGIPAEHIQRIEIAARTDVNPNVNATLECSIWMTCGVVRARPQWCARSTSRADEIVNTLLLPLVAHKVMDKVYMVDGQGYHQRLPAHYSGIVEQVFGLAGYPEAANSEAYGRRLQHYTSQMVAAGNQ